MIPAVLHSGVSSHRQLHCSFHLLLLLSCIVLISALASQPSRPCRLASRRGISILLISLSELLSSTCVPLTTARQSQPSRSCRSASRPRFLDPCALLQLPTAAAVCPSPPARYLNFPPSVLKFTISICFVYIHSCMVSSLLLMLGTTTLHPCLFHAVSTHSSSASVFWRSRSYYLRCITSLGPAIVPVVQPTSHGSSSISSAFVPTSPGFCLYRTPSSVRDTLYRLPLPAPLA